MHLPLIRIVASFALISCLGVMPRNLKIDYCVSFWGKNITCYWDLLPEMDSPTMYTLLVTEESGRCRRDFGLPKSCLVSQGENSCGVPAENLFAFYKVRLTAENRHLRVESSEKCIHGMSIVKLSPPWLMVIANQTRCLQLGWDFHTDELLSVSEAQYEIQYRDLAEVSWTQVNFTAVENTPAFASICGLFPFTNYSVRVRAKYLPSPAFHSDGNPFWSDWSMERMARTLTAVPSRGPALWRKLGSPHADRKRVVVLMWKPLMPKEANGEILGYSLHSQRNGELVIPECLTQDLHCTLRLPAREEIVFFLTAKNTVGISPPTKLVIPASDKPEAPPSPLPLLASPAGDHGLLLQWSSPSFPRMHYVLEWNKEGSETHWCYQDQPGNQVVITEAIQPGSRYTLKIFGLLDGRLWAFGSTKAYSKQIAPLRAPNLYPTQVWKSRVELQWERLPLEERGGEIWNYTLYYKEESQDDYLVVVLDSSVHRFVINSLAPGSIVRVYIVAANEGGSTRGSVLSIRTKSNDYGKVEILLSVFCVGFIVLLAGTLGCLSRHRSLRKYLWPQIPDPAKSNLAAWMPQNVCLDFDPHCSEKWSQGYLGMTISSLLRVFPSQPEEQEPKSFLGNQRLVDSPNSLWTTVSMVKSGIASWKAGKKPLANWNEVEYARVLVVQKNHGPGKPWSSPPCAWSLSDPSAPANHRSEPLFGEELWFQNLTYETLLDNRATLESTGEFPLLVAVEGELHPAKRPHP